MKASDRIRQALNKKIDLETGDLDTLLYLAWWMGYEAATKDVSDRYSQILRDQHARAARCRYRNMAESVIGFKGSYIYLWDYSQPVTKELALGIDTTL